MINICIDASKYDEGDESSVGYAPSKESKNTGDASTSIGAKSYWSAEYHSAASLLKAENWRTAEISAFCLPTLKEYAIKLDGVLIRALLRYREEILFFAALSDEKNNANATSKNRSKNASSAASNPPPSVIYNPEFLMEQDERVKADWNSGERLQLYQVIQSFVNEFDRMFKNDFSHTDSVFIKLSSRSPKDAVMSLQVTRDEIERMTCALNSDPPLQLEDPRRLGEDVNVLKLASWNGLKVKCGMDALLLLTRSERIYMDLLQAQLFHNTQKASHQPSAPLSLNLCIYDFYKDLNPNYEFRGFVCGGLKTALTVYNPWVYDENLISHKDRIERLIMDLWDAIEPHFSKKSSDYCLDFAVSTDLSSVFLVEINNTLPPLAGSGLFNYYNEKDRDIMKKGPFEFRIKQSFVTPEDFVIEGINPQTNQPFEQRIMPASPDVMMFLESCRKRALGLPIFDDIDIEGVQDSNEPAAENTSLHSCYCQCLLS